MQSLASPSVIASAFIILALGAAHLLLTFRGTRLHPREPEVMEGMARSHLVITRETTMWKAWVGFNASHSFGAILFGALYGYLGAVHPALLFHSPFLLVVGACLLGGYVALGRAYWFSVPYRFILLASAFYLASLALYWL